MATLIWHSRPTYAVRAVLPTLLALFAAAGAVRAQQPRTESEIKAAYLFTFGRFVEWPARAAAGDVAICVLGADPFGPVLDATLTAATLRGRKVVATRVRTLEEAAPCHILFVSASEERQLPAIVAALARRDVLTVSDMPRFVGRGGMVQFVTAGSRVRFEIDLAAALDAGLMLSSDLLRVASAVRRGPQAGP